MPFFHFSWKKHKKRDEWAKLDKAGGKCVDSWKPKPEWDLSHQFLNRLPETVVKAGMFIVFVTRWMSIYRASLMVPSIIQWPVLKHPPCRTREKIKRTQHKPSVKSGKCVVHFRDTESLNSLHNQTQRNSRIMQNNAHLTLKTDYLHCFASHNTASMRDLGTSLLTKEISAKLDLSENDLRGNPP